MLPPCRRKRRSGVGFNTNLDNMSGTWGTAASQYYNGVLGDTLFAGESPFLTHIREAALKNGVAPSTPGTDDGSAADLAPYQRILDLPFIPKLGGGVLCQPLVERARPYDMPSGEHQTPSTLDDAHIWGPRKEHEVRWRLACIANAFPDRGGPRGIWGWLGPNEADFNPWRFQQKYDDGHWLAAGPAQSLALDRVVLLATWMQEELRHNRWWTRQAHPGILFTPTTSSQALKTGSWTGWTAEQMYAHQDAALLGLVDAAATTWHHTQSTFERGKPIKGRISAYWLWAALQNARKIWEGAGKGPGPQIPVCATEYGVDFEVLVPSTGYYSTPLGAKYLKAYRLGLAACARFFWALPVVTLYSVTGSGSDGQNFYDKGAPFASREPDASTMREVFDDRKYMLSGAPPWSLPITPKAWPHADGQEYCSGYHRGYTWAVAAPLYETPADNLTLADPPKPNWLNITITENLITSAPFPAPNPRFVQAFLRPVIMPAHGTYRVTAEVMVSGGGRIALVVRGHNLLDGLEETAAESTASGWVTLAVTFTTVPHRVSNLPNLAQACIMLEHDGIGTAQMRNVCISPA